MKVERQAVRAVVVIFSVCLTGGITAPILAQGWGPWGGGGGERRAPQPSGQWGEWGGGERRVPQPQPLPNPENLQPQIVVTGRTTNCRECIVAEKFVDYRNGGNVPESISVNESRTRSNSLNINAGIDAKIISTGVGYDVGGSRGASYTATLTVEPNHRGVIIGHDYYRKTYFQIVSGGRVIHQGSSMEFIGEKTSSYLIPPGGSRSTGRGRYPTGGGVTPY